MIADKRSIAINPLATDSANPEIRNLPLLYYLFFFCYLFLDPRVASQNSRNPSNFSSINLAGPGGIGTRGLPGPRGGSSPRKPAALRRGAPRPARHRSLA